MNENTTGGSCARYKRMTDVVVTWLVDEADALDYESVEPQRTTFGNTPMLLTLLSHAERLREKADEKRAKNAEKKVSKREAQKAPSLNPHQGISPTANRTVSMKELLLRTKFVVSKQPCQLPWIIFRILKHAIEARKRCFMWFQVTGTANGYSNQVHSDFIEVIEQIAELLKPRLMMLVASSTTTPIETRNAFKGLENAEEDTEDIDIDDPLEIWKLLEV